MIRRIGVRYTLYFFLLAAGLVLLTLLLVGSMTSNLRDDVQQQMVASFADSQEQAVKVILKDSTRFLSSRLFSSLYHLDISELNDEIDNVRRWLPVKSFVIADADARILTDGTEENPNYGKKMPVPVELEANTLYRFRTESDTLEIYFQILSEDVIAGFGLLNLDIAVLEANREQLSNQLMPIWSELDTDIKWLSGNILIIVGAIALLLGALLSRSYIMPLQEMGLAARHFANGNFDYQLSEHSDNELGELAGSLNSMAKGLQKNGRLLTRAQEIANLGSWEWQFGADNLILSPQLLNMLNLKQLDSSISLNEFFELVEITHRERVQRQFNQANDQTFAIKFPVRIDSKSITLLMRGETLVSNQQPTGYIGTLQDISEQQRVEKKLTQLANFDSLTQLPNRHLLQERLNRAMTRVDRNGGQLALMFLDLDGFKAINDALGHQSGDEVLKVVANRLVEVVRAEDTIARLGGDEFTVLLENCSDGLSITRVADKILEALLPEVPLFGRSFHISASIGITLYPDDGKDASTLLKNADTAMYLAKERGRGQYRFFTPALEERVQHRLEIEARLREAIQNQEFELHFQPQIDINSNQLRGAEALLRWRDSGELRSPAEFLPVLEETGLLLKLTRWIIEEACEQLKIAQAEVDHPIVMAINLSAAQLQDPLLPMWIEQILAKTGLGGRQLEFEITENGLLELDAANDIAQQLQKLGIELAIDDFGTGYSSWSRLKELHVDTLKIDRSFVADIESCKDDRLIITAVIDLCHKLGLNVVAEGVENQRQIDFLIENRCQHAQGYHLARPLPSNEFLRWVGNYSEMYSPQSS